MLTHHEKSPACSGQGAGPPSRREKSPRVEPNGEPHRLVRAVEVRAVGAGAPRGVAEQVKATGGYTLVAVVVFMFLLSISLMAVVPAVSKIMQRDKEDELIFRGKQYAQAMLNFQKRQGRYPLNLKELMLTHPRSARKLFKEPMCDCADWGLIRAGDPWPRVKPVKLDSGFRESTSTASPPSTSSSASGSSTTGAPAPTSASSSGQPGSPFSTVDGEEKSNRPIIGVYSTLHAKGLRTFKGKEYYDEWGFIAGQNNDDIPGVTIPGGQGPANLVQPIQNPQPGRSTSGRN